MLVDKSTLFQLCLPVSEVSVHHHSPFIHLTISRISLASSLVQLVFLILFAPYSQTILHIKSKETKIILIDPWMKTH